MSNYPAGVTDAHPHFNPPTCPECGEEAMPGEDCPECGSYLYSPDELAEIAAEDAYDRMRDER